MGLILIPYGIALAFGKGLLGLAFVLVLSGIGFVLGKATKTREVRAYPPLCRSLAERIRLGGRRLDEEGLAAFLSRACARHRRRSATRRSRVPGPEICGAIGPEAKPCGRTSMEKHRCREAQPRLCDSLSAFCFAFSQGLGRDASLFAMDRIADSFARARREGRAAFVAYLCAGDPDFAASLAACRAVIEAGIDVLELGVAFSDPLADGLTNQLAAQRALESGMTPTRTLELVREIRKFSQVPIVFYTYYNLVFANGVGASVRAMKEAGVDGLLTLDLPPEEAGEVQAACAANDLKTVFIAAPTTPEARLGTITAAATGFIYYVSREGVTGVRSQLAGNIPEAVAAIKRHTPLPVVVGFGISTAEQVREVGVAADGVVVGSALVNVIKEHLADRAAIHPAMFARAQELVAGLSPRLPACG